MRRPAINELPDELVGQLIEIYPPIAFDPTVKLVLYTQLKNLQSKRTPRLTLLVLSH